MKTLHTLLIFLVSLSLNPLQAFARSDLPLIQRQVRLLVMGDSLSQGLQQKLNLLHDRQFVNVMERGRLNSGLANLREYNWVAEAERLASNSNERIDVAIILVGANDLTNLTDPNVRGRVGYATPEFYAGYGERVQQVANSFLSRGIHVVWVGTPLGGRTASLENQTAILDVTIRSALENLASSRSQSAATTSPSAELVYLSLRDMTTTDQNSYQANFWNGQTYRHSVRGEDRFHFSDGGYFLIADVVSQAVEEVLGSSLPRRANWERSIPVPTAPRTR